MNHLLQILLSNLNNLRLKKGLFFSTRSDDKVDKHDVEFVNLLLFTSAPSQRGHCFFTKA